MEHNTQAMMNPYRAKARGGDNLLGQTVMTVPPIHSNKSDYLKLSEQIKGQYSRARKVLSMRVED